MSQLFFLLALQIPKLGQEKRERRQNWVGLGSTVAYFQQNDNIISKSKIYMIAVDTELRQIIP